MFTPQPHDYVPPDSFKHQADILHETVDVYSYALFWEMGCGKTKPTIDTFARLYKENKVDSLIVVAPNGVHANWMTDELPRHCPGWLQRHLYVHCYYSSRANTRTHRRSLEELLYRKRGKVLIMSYDAVMTKKGYAALMGVLESDNKVMYVLDESGRIKNPGAKRTKRILSTASYAKYRRILTGTPIANGPFDVYSQVRFLHPKYWVKYGLNSFYAFKHYFGVFQQGQNGDRTYEWCVAYQRLEDLSDMLKPISSRLTKEQVLDLPPKLYRTVSFDMTRDQKAAYQQLRDEFILMLNSGEIVDAPLVIQRITKWQQITSGYVAYDSEQPVEILADPNPRLELLHQIVQDTPHKCIIWAKFHKDIDQIKELFRPEEYVVYDGRTSDDDRIKARNGFQSPDGPRFFIANPAAAGEGLTLHAAKTVIYYNCSYKLTDRLQSEDRAHRIGQNSPVQYIDLVARGTIDEHIVKRLVAKKTISSKVLGDEVRSWLNL